MFHVPNNWRVRRGMTGTDEGYGNNGTFMMPVNETAMAHIQASDGGDWEHVSVSVTLTDRARCPTWDEMAFVAKVFWDEDDVLVQYRPAKADYVNCHPYVLHWWRPIGQKLPAPPSIFVGPKEVSA